MPRAVQALAVAALLAAACGAAAVADAPSLPPAEFKLAPPGTVFHWKSGRRTIVGTPDGHFAQSTHSGRPNVFFLFGLIVPAYVLGDDRVQLDGIWPLTLGKTVRFHRHQPQGTRLSWTDQLSVVRTDTLSINGRPIDTYVLQWTSKGDLQLWRGSQTTWYAPSLGWAVKRHYVDNAGLTDDDQVVAYDVPPKT
ncbi:MAG TPA: hypothetical protein VGD01_18230 [Candidatus Elarobacter sp.]